MSVQAMSWVFDNSRSDLGARLVLLSIANHADKHGGESWPGAATIADEAKLSTRQVTRCIKTLEGLGELVVFEKVKRVGIRGSKNMYGLPLMPRYEPPEGLTSRLDNMSGRETADDPTSATPQPDTLDTDNPTSDAKNGGSTTSLEPSLEPSIEPSARTVPLFEDFWRAYPKRNDHTRGAKQPAADKWRKLSDDDRRLAFLACPIYAEAIDPGFYKDAVRFLRDRIFDDYQHAPVRPMNAAERVIARVHAEEAARPPEPPRPALPPPPEPADDEEVW